MAQIASINQGTKNLGVIGSTEYVSIGKLERIPAKQILLQSGLRTS